RSCRSSRHRCAPRAPPPGRADPPARAVRADPTTAASTTMTERSARLVPPHVLVMLSTSTAAYALALAGVAGQQSAADASLAAERAPLARAVEQVSVGHDQ